MTERPVCDLCWIRIDGASGPLPTSESGNQYMPSALEAEAAHNYHKRSAAVGPTVKLVPLGRLHRCKKGCYAKVQQQVERDREKKKLRSADPAQIPAPAAERAPRPASWRRSASSLARHRSCSSCPTASCRSR